MSSRIWVTVEPVTAAFSTAARDAELRPSRRASSWLTWTRSWRAGSFQSKLICRASGSVAITCARSNAIARTWSMSGPLTRYCTGQPTGGPSSSGEIRLTTPGNSSASSCSSLRLQALPGGDVLGDDDRLREEIVRQLHVQRQVEADRARPT